MSLVAVMFRYNADTIQEFSQFSSVVEKGFDKFKKSKYIIF